jgi:N-acetyltransferase
MYSARMNWAEFPKTLRDDFVRLEPLSMDHHDELTTALLPDPEGWYQKMFALSTPELLLREIKAADKGFADRNIIAFAIRDLKSGRLAGRSQFMKIDVENRHVEIGNTMVGPDFRRTHVNTHAKYLMLKEAFEAMNMNRVSFRIDEANLRSRNAIERLGALYGGRLRAERILPDGRIRDYTFYCILQREWSETKTRLETRITQRAQ